MSNTFCCIWMNKKKWKGDGANDEVEKNKYGAFRSFEDTLEVKDKDVHIS